MFAMNAEPLLKIARFNGVQFDKKDELNLMKKAESYGIAAAKAGVEDAYWFMARAYYTGLFGARDSVKAYAYTLPLVKMQNENDAQERLDILSKELTTLQVKQAQLIAFGCNEDFSKVESISNPFMR